MNELKRNTLDTPSGSTIVIERADEAIADYISIPYVTIRDKEPRSKRGVSDYCIRGCKMWRDEGYKRVGYWSWWVEIECNWLHFDADKSFDTLRECSDYIRRYIYQSNGEADS